MGNRHLEAGRAVFPTNSPYRDLLRDGSGEYFPIPSLANPELWAGRGSTDSKRRIVFAPFTYDQTQSFTVPLLQDKYKLPPDSIEDVVVHTQKIVSLHEAALREWMERFSSQANMIQVILGCNWGLEPVSIIKDAINGLGFTADSQVYPLPSRKRFQHYGFFIAA